MALWDADTELAYAILRIEAYRPAWHADAACRGLSEQFFPRRGQDVRPAVAVCASCPVGVECAQFARGFDPTTLRGIWAGRSERERRQVRKAGRLVRSTPPARDEPAA